MLQMEVTHDIPPGLSSPLPGAITIYTTGTISCILTGSGTTPQINGTDSNPNAPAGTGVYAVATNHAIATPPPAGNVDCAAGDSITGVPSVSNYAYPIPAAWGSNINSTVASIEAIADNVYSGTLGGNLGCSGANWDPRITVLTNPPATIGPTGCGILVVFATASLDLFSSLNWQGLIVVFTKVPAMTLRPRLLGNEIQGGLLFASNTGSNLTVDTHNGGLSNGIQYDTRYLNYVSDRPLRVVGFREVIN